jgi:putative addiction module component (TIGR02574 family)
MSETAQSILAAINSLPDEERAELIDRLLEDHSPPPDWVEMSEEKFRAELDRRIEECRDGTDPGIPAEQVLREVMEMIDAKSSPELSPACPPRNP